MLVETEAPLPERLSNSLERDCSEEENVTDGLTLRCGFLGIAHNSNLGGGTGREFRLKWQKETTMTFRVFRHPKLELVLLLAALVVLMAAFPISAEPPFDRTEERDQCAHYDALKQPFFGETHLHTAYSFDASTLDTRNTPRDAYIYARGGKVGLPPWADTRKELDVPGNEETSVAKFPYCFPGENCEFMASRTVQLPPSRAAGRE